MVNVYWNPRMDGKFTNYGYAVDWENIKMRYMANDTKGTQKFRIEEDVQAMGASSQKCKIYADIGIEIRTKLNTVFFIIINRGFMPLILRSTIMVIF